MQVHSFAYDLETKAWSTPLSSLSDSPRTLVLAFGATEILQAPECIAQLARAYPRSVVVGCSSAGEIHGTEIRDRSLSVSVTRFDRTDLVLTSLEVPSASDSFGTGQLLAKKLAAKPGLRGVMILSEGLNVNGSELVRGLSSVLDETVVVTGGLSGDGTRFKQTWVAIGPKVKPNVVAAVGFYGDFIQIGHGSKGGWDKFGPERVVTRSEGNVLFELDGKPALALYKEYLGDKAKDLPASGLLFPLSLRSSNKDDKFVVRTLLAVDHEKSSLTFAGDVPKGHLVQLMKADFDRLIGGAATATAMAKDNGAPIGKDALVVAISCVGRRLVLGERTEEEVEAVLEAFPKAQHAHITGFYSYGEISPYAAGHSDLHNQTMTLTVLSESPTPLPKRTAAPKTEGGSITVRPPPAPLPAAAAPPPMRAPGVARTPLDDIDLELTTSTNTRPLVAIPDGFGVATFGYDLDSKKWSIGAFPELDSARTLVLAFGASEMLGEAESLAQLARAYPRSIVVGCSSAGEIHGTSVRDRSLSVSVARFEKTDLALASLEVDGPGESFGTGQLLAKKLAAKPGLRGVMILSEGLNVNGSELVRGLSSVLDESVVVTGGLSGDGSRFKQTWVAIGPKVKSNVVAAVGFYGDFVQIGHGSKGGWDKFGPERVVTRSEGNVLFELDGKPALALYKEYLGDKAKDLPASGLLFPLSLRSSNKDDKFVVRTLLAVDHEKSSLTFAGDVPKGHLVQLMKADFDRLIGGAATAAGMAKDNGMPVGKDVLVVAISCVGRRLVLGERTEEEVEAVLEALPKAQHAHITGFYSYGEISPYAAGHSDLHNQTMTLTVISESPTPLPRRAGARRTSGTFAPAKAPPVPPPPARVAPPASATSPSLLVPSSESTLSAVTPLASPPPPEPSSAPSSARRSGPVTRVPALASGAANAVVHKQQRGTITLLSITGRLTETFKGDALGRELRGTVAIDLGGVERITSFGVREWLAMLGALQEVRRLFLLRCSEAVVNQLSMIRKFSGNGQIVSFFAPYLCGTCGEQFERKFDCETEADSIRAGIAPDASCAHCGAQGSFDDDARTYFAFAAPHLNTAVPAEVRALQDELDAAAPPPSRDAVDKSVEGNVTRVRVNAKLGASVRWKRVLDGIEGALVIDLGGVTGVEPTGITNLEQALAALGPEVMSIAIERCPSALVERFAQVGVPQRVTVTSGTLDAYCASCAVHRPALVSIVEHGEALAAGVLPRVNCKRCNGELALRNADGALRFLQAQRGADKNDRPGPASLGLPVPSQGNVPISLAGIAVAPRPSPQAADMPATLDAPTPTKRPRAATFAIGALSLAVVGLVGLQLVRSAQSSPTTQPAAGAGATSTTTPPGPGGEAASSPKESAPAAPQPGSSNAWMQNVDLPPAWVERPFVLDGSDVFVVGRSDLSASPELAMTSARNDAIVRVVKQLHQDLAGTPVHDFVQARIHDDRAASEAIATRYLKQFGTTASPERVDAALRKRESGVEGFARYKLSKSTYAQLLASYRETSNVQGMVVARFFPLLETALHTEGDLVVLSVQRGRPAEAQNARAGDIVIDVAGRPTPTLDALAKASAEEWANTPVRGQMAIDIESAGAKRTMKIWKPAPPGPGN